MPFTISLEGKVAVVSGGSRGIGAECCRQLATAGASVAFTHTGSARGGEAAEALVCEINSMGARAYVSAAEVSSEEDVRRFIAEVIKKFGRIDILVNNAATMAYSPLESMGLDEWRRVMGVNLDGPMLMTRETLPHMLRQGGGCIIMISTNAVINGGGNSAHYPASKAGMEGLAVALARDYSSRGIRANIVRPAVIDTDLLRERYPTDEDMAKYAASIPVRRVGKPEDIANAVVFLASDKASYISGAALNVDGGRTYYK